MSNQFLKLRRSAVPGKIPDTGSLDLGEIALNTHDGLAFMKKSVGGNDSIVVIGNSTGSFTGSFSGEFTGSLLGTSSWAYNAVTASTADDFYVRGNVTGSNAIFSGTVTAQRLVVQTISSSVIYSSGSNIFGDELTDTQQFTGSVTITGSLSLNNDPVVTLIPYNTFSSSIQLRATKLESTASILTAASASLAIDSGSNSIRFTNLEVTSSVVSASYASASGSLSTRVTNLETTASVLTTASASFAVVSASYSDASQSLSIRTTNLEITSSIVSASYASASGSLSTRVTNLESTASVLTTASASFAVVSGSYASASGSLSTRTTNLESTASVLTLASASFSIVSASYASASGSFSTRVTTLENASASFAQDSGSNSIRITNLESTASILTTASASFSIVSASYASASGSLSTRVTTLENASASFAQDSGSNSIRLTNLESTASVLTQASASFSSSIASLSNSFTSFSSSYLIDSASWNNNISLLSQSFLQTSQSLSASIQLLSSSFLAFSQSYNTGSFTGSFNGQATLTGSFTGKFYGDLSGSFSGSVANIDGATNYIARFDTPNSVDSSVIYQSASHIAINETSFTTGNPEALYVFQTNPTSINVITGKGNTNNYLQLNIQNTNQGVQASSDIVATANNGNENSNYIDMGINSENFNTGFIGGANDAYVYSIANNLHIGNAATNGTHLGLFVGGTDVEANSKLQLNAVGKHIMSGSLAITGSLSVQQGVTASLFGTASWAVSASHAPTALSSSYAISASYALQAATSSFATTASYIANVVYTTGSQTISGFKTFTDRTTFNNHIVMDGTGSTNYTLAFKQPSALNFYSGDYTEIGAFGGTELDFNFGQIAGGYRRFAFNVANLSLSTPRTYQFPDKTGLLLIDDITSGSVATSSFSITSSYSLNAISAVSASYAATASSADNFFVRQNITASNALIYGSLTAQTIYAQYITASTELITGSTKFGTQLTDTHQFTGSVTITGSLSLNNDPVVTQTAYNNFSQSIQSRATKLEATSSILTDASASFAIVSSSFATTSASLSIRTTDLESTASILTLASASFATVSSSFATTSASLSTRTTDLESTASVLTSASASFAIVSSSYASASGSLSTRVTILEQASASFSLVSASYSAFSQSYNTGSFTGSFTGVGSLTGSLFGTSSWANNAVTSSYILQAVSASFATTASYSISSSYAYNADLLDGKDSSTFATTGSNIFVGNQTVTGSLFTSGSNTLIGSTTLTGSLRITGSTIQTGNNTLIGNTSLSGSLTISGSQGAGVPSINIYGDIEQRGYTRYLPVTTNINTSISASYIFVSGSTEDLYFSQNSKGYSNVTRLRWLEGNLYTGLLNGGLISTQSSTVYQISSGSGIIVNLNASYNDNPYPTIQYLNWNTLSASIAPFTASYQQAFVGIDSTNNIYAQGTPFSNGQFDAIINIGNVLFQNQSTINGVKTQPSTAYGFEQAQNVFNRAFGPLKLSGYTLAPSGSSTGSLVVGSGTAYSPGANYTVDPNEPYYAVDNGTSISKIFRYHQSGSTWVYNTNAGAGFATIDPTQYSNNGVLTAVPSPVGSRWTIQRVFWFPNSVTKAIVVYYGNAFYGSESEAIANINIEPFVEAPNTAANAIYLGAIVINGDGIFTDAADFTIVPGGLFRSVGGSGGGGSLITQTLAGLSDVSISGPTNGQPLVYKNTSGKWENSSTLTADLTGNASTATTASFAVTASYVLQAVSSSFATTASYVQNAQSASYVLQAVSASFATTASYVQNAESASYILQAVSASFASQASTASYVLQAVSASFATNASTASYVLQSVSASFASNASTASYILEAVSASYAATASSADSFLVRQNITASNALIIGTLTAQTIVAQTITSSTEYITGSTIFGSVITNTHQFTGSVSISGSLRVSDGVVNNLTASWAINAISSSYAATASIATSSSYAFNATTASYALNATSASYSINATSASYALNSTSASYSLTATSASYALIATSASYAATASFIPTSSLTGDFFIQGGNSFGAPATLGTNDTQNLQLETSGSVRVFVSGSNGFVGIDTIAPAYKLDVNGEIRAKTDAFIHNPTGEARLELGRSITGSRAVLFSDYTAGLVYYEPGFSNYVFDYDRFADSTIFQTNGSDKLTITNSGSIRFNTYTTNGLLKTTGSNGTVVMATASVDYVIPSTLNNYVLNSQTSSMSVLSSSYALTASYALNAGSGGGGGISAIYIADQGTLLGTASYFDFTGNVSASVSNGTASINIVGTGGAQFFTQSIAAATWSLDHNLNTYTPLIQVYDLTYRQLIPNEVIGITPSLSEIRFDYSQSGYAIVSTGGSLTITGSTAQLFQTTPAVTWSFAHNLNTRYPVFQVYDTGHNVIVPSGIYAVNSSNAEIYFAVPTAGIAVADFSGISGLQDTVISSSYAATASLVLGTISSASYATNADTASTGVNFRISNTLTLDATLTDYASINSSVVGSNNLFTQATGSYTSGFFKYTAASGLNARSGEVIAVWNGSNVTFTDNSTTDVGSTTAVTASVSLVSGDVQFNMQTNSSGWKIKSLATFM